MKILKLIITYLLILNFNIYSQVNNILYYMKGVPQSYLLNPATQPRCKFHLGIPGISPIYAGFESSSLHLGDIIMKNGDSLITFLHPLADKSKFLNNLGKVNYFSVDHMSNLFSIGFRVDEASFFSFDISEKTFARLSYPGDIFNFLLEGNKKGDEFDFSGTGVNLTSYLEIGMGISTQKSDNFSYGYRGKILFGIANVSTRKTDITATTDEAVTLKSKFELNTSLLGVKIARNQEGKFNFDSIDFVKSDSMDVSDLVYDALSNFGLGLDFGIHYKPIENITLSASLIDFGFIRWNKWNYNIKQDAEFVFDGIEWNPSDTTDFGEKLLDSLKNAFTMTYENKSYTTFLPVKIYLGFKYEPFEQLSFSVLSRTEIYKGRLREALSFGLNLFPIKMLALSFNYTIANKSYNNFGAGLALKLLPLNIYVISDNIPLILAKDKSNGFYIPYEARVFNIRFGVNFMFGCRVKKVDIPLFYNF